MMGPLPLPVDDKQDEGLVEPPKNEDRYESLNGARGMVNGIENEHKGSYSKIEPKDNEIKSASAHLSNGLSANACPRSSRRSSRFEPKSKESPKSLEPLAQDDCGDNARDSLIDTIPFGMDGIQTVVKNQLKKDVNSKNSESCLEDPSVESEMERVKEENLQLKKALKEAAYVNQQWKNYHDHKQTLLHKLQSTINELRKEAADKQTSGTAAAELQKLKDAYAHQQKEHHDRVQLLQVQVRALKDDWEAERCEKQIAEVGRMQAEQQVDMLQKIFHHLMAKMAALEEHQQLCRCCHNFSNGISPTIEENFYSAAAYSKERQERRSPSKHSTSSSGNHSRSSSLSFESSPTSPVFTKNLLCVSHSRRSSSPRSKTSSPGPSVGSATKSASNGFFIVDPQHRDSHEDVSSGGQRPVINQMKEPNSLNEHSTIAKQKESKNIALNKESSNDQRNISDSATVNVSNNLSSSQAQDFRSAKTKSLPKLDYDINWNEDIDAKHRARTILASALPMSPSTTNPSSPVTMTPAKHSSSKSTAATSSSPHTKFRPPFVAHKRPKSVTSSQFPKGKDHKEEKARSTGNKRDLRNMKRQSSRVDAENGSVRVLHDRVSEVDAASRQAKHQSTKVDRESADVEESSCASNITSVVEDRTHITEIHSTTHSVFDSRKEANEENCATARNTICTTSKGRTNAGSISCNANKENSLNSSIKSEDNIKVDCQNNASENDQCDTNSNYASITVMSNSSIIHPQSQVASSTSSRSSSPGISLMTFALNAEGQGVPGAILFAIGPDTKSPKPVQNNIQCLSVTSSSNGVDDIREYIKDKSPGVTITTEYSPNNQGGKLVNSAWVKLMDKENNLSKSPNGIPWRTARAVPSHQLNSSRKTSSEEISNSDNCPNGSQDKAPQVYSYIQTKAVQTIPEASDQMIRNTNESKVLNDTSCSTCSYSVSGEVNAILHEIPTIIYPSPCIHSSSHSKEASPTSANEVDLKSLASRNITSAILSYECNNKETKGSHSKTNRNHTKHKSEKKTYVEGAIPDGWASIHCLTCPRCQMLFHEEQMHSFTKHIQLCGGPKYVDM